MNYVPNVDANFSEGATDHALATKKMAAYLGSVLMTDVMGEDIKGGGMVRMMDMVTHFRDFDAVWKRYCGMVRFERDVEMAGMQVEKEEMRWRLDVRVGRERREVVREAREIALGGVNGSERLVVFGRVRMTAPTLVDRHLRTMEMMGFGRRG